MWHPHSLLQLLCAAVAFSPLASRLSGQQQPGIAPPSKNDTYAEDEKGRKFRVQRGELPAANFQIAGVDLLKQEDVLTQAARIFGSMESAASGDAGDYDESACYRSGDETHVERLFFGKGEMDSYFTLVAGDGPLKHGQKCRRSPLVTHAIATAAGIHLGMSTNELIAALGLPTRRSQIRKSHAERLVWELELQKRTRPRDLAQYRKDYPQESEAEIQANYRFYSQSERIVAVVTGGVLTELTADWLASY